MTNRRDALKTMAGAVGLAVVPRVAEGKAATLVPLPTEDIETRAARWAIETYNEAVAAHNKTLSLIASEFHAVASDEYARHLKEGRERQIADLARSIRNMAGRKLNVPAANRGILSDGSLLKLKFTNNGGVGEPWLWVEVPVGDHASRYAWFTAHGQGET